MIPSVPPVGIPINVPPANSPLCANIDFDELLLKALEDLNIGMRYCNGFWFWRWRWNFHIYIPYDCFIKYFLTGAIPSQIGMAQSLSSLQLGALSIWISL